MFEQGTAQGHHDCQGDRRDLPREIGAVSSPGKGSTFWAILPLNTGTDDHADDGAGHGERTCPVRK
ncbi:MAG: hypothetical protein ACLR8Y_22095 [Alistipes indistinctus]